MEWYPSSIMWRIATYLLNLLEIGSTIAVKIGLLGGNADTFMPIFFADVLGFAPVIKAKLELEIEFVENVPDPNPRSK